MYLAVPGGQNSLQHDGLNRLVELPELVVLVLELVGVAQGHNLTAFMEVLVLELKEGQLTVPVRPHNHPRHAGQGP